MATCLDVDKLLAVQIDSMSSYLGYSHILSELYSNPNVWDLYTHLKKTNRRIQSSKNNCRFNDLKKAKCGLSYNLSVLKQRSDIERHGEDSKTDVKRDRLIADDHHITDDTIESMNSSQLPELRRVFRALDKELYKCSSPRNKNQDVLISPPPSTIDVTLKALWRHRHPLDLRHEQERKSLQESEKISLFPNIQHQSLDSIRIPSSYLTESSPRIPSALEKVLKNSSATYNTRQKQQYYKEQSLRRAKLNHINNISNVATQRLRLKNCGHSASSSHKLRYEASKQRPGSMIVLDIRPETKPHVMFNKLDVSYSPSRESTTPRVKMSLTKLRASIKKGPYLSMAPTMAYHPPSLPESSLKYLISSNERELSPVPPPCNSPVYQKTSSVKPESKTRQEYKTGYENKPTAFTPSATTTIPSTSHSNPTVETRVVFGKSSYINERSPVVIPTGGY